MTDFSYTSLAKLCRRSAAGVSQIAITPGVGAPPPQEQGAALVFRLQAVRRLRAPEPVPSLCRLSLRERRSFAERKTTFVEAERRSPAEAGAPELIPR